ncbi:radical SAM/SPASM domain-containing protein [Bradyrhizobium japonicum]|uniref:radical SAM/SPASM domain-containing protein n=1 Tax=Bradyrhizobium japonicum TaxID=375 RepID=UPI0007C46604|nr:radical SAM protein [Bradyrhizobium japonicum]
MAHLISSDGTPPPLGFLWLELTNRCNLQCAHCYSESGPTTGDTDILSDDDYRRLILEAAHLGCRRIQFIGGEPTLNPILPGLIETATEEKFEFIEVFSNVMRLHESLLTLFARRRVHVATSIYAAEPEIHDKITRQRGSHARTVGNLKRLLAKKIDVRVGVIEMGLNCSMIDGTIEWLHALGVQNVNTSRVRFFGRAALETLPTMSELCGECARDTLCVTADGRVTPCIMSRHWPVGWAASEPLREVLHSEKLQTTRLQIRNATQSDAGLIRAICTPKVCDPRCNPCRPSCGPQSECNPCYPKG